MIGVKGCKFQKNMVLWGIDDLLVVLSTQHTDSFIMLMLQFAIVINLETWQFVDMSVNYSDFFNNTNMTTTHATFSARVLSPYILPPKNRQEYYVSSVNFRVNLHNRMPIYLHTYILCAKHILGNLKLPICSIFRG